MMKADNCLVSVHVYVLLHQIKITLNERQYQFCLSMAERANKVFTNLQQRTTVVFSYIFLALFYYILVFFISFLVVF